MNIALETPAPAAQPKAVRPAKPKILLVDDDPGIRQILLRLLVEEGYVVQTAGNGIVALDLASTTQFDLVLLDLNMPVKDGWETYTQLLITHPLLPIILITARPNQFFPALASGVGALLEKPLDFVKLLSTMKSLLDEPVEMRRARHAGQASVFRYIPQISEEPKKPSNLDK